VHVTQGEPYTDTSQGATEEGRQGLPSLGRPSTSSSDGTPQKRELMVRF
jgi:hypothetical protein